MDLCFELASQIMERLGDSVTPVDEVQAFRYFDDRDLIGFVDGTENPRGQAVEDAVLIGDEDPLFANGSYVLVQKYLHNMDGWNRLTTEQQELHHRSAGSSRTLSWTTRPSLPSAHNALTVIEENGKEVKILRDNMPFGRPSDGEFGTYFIGYGRLSADDAKKCSKICSSDARPEITIACSISAAPSRVVCSSFHPPRSSTK